MTRILIYDKETDSYLKLNCFSVRDIIYHLALFMFYVIGNNCLCNLYVRVICDFYWQINEDNEIFKKKKSTVID